MAKLTDLVGIPVGINTGQHGAGNALMLALLGNPRDSYSQNCQPVTNSDLVPRIVSANFGPFKATGFDLAVEALKLVLADIKSEQPDVFAALGTEGMLCARNVRGSSTSVSNHSWGCAIDLTIGGVLDTRGDNKVQFGLTLIAPIFNRRDWYWGAGFPTEDGMHFEIAFLQ